MENPIPYDEDQSVAVLREILAEFALAVVGAWKRNSDSEMDGAIDLAVQQITAAR